ncbi:MAG: hypothetical protein MOB07_04460 [Acidobacteria bacterium]|nr:hypothetical protein [Acidobacteriota bacterium]
MKRSYLRKVTLIGAVIISLQVMSVGVLAQTQTRPKVVTNTPTSYRYAYQHGYRAGYEDGFIKGKSDFNENQPRDIDSSEAYRSADRGYSERMGTRAEYQEGYRIGFELAYGDGYYGRPYSISIPSNLGKAVITAVNGVSNDEVPATRPRPVDETDRVQDVRPTSTGGSASRGSFRVPDGIQMKIRLTTQISTKTNRDGDRFTAVVLDPSDYADAVIEGHISKLTKSGKATGKTEIALAFDSIRLNNGRTGSLAAQVERVYQSEKVKTVDEEGNVQTGDRTKDTAVRGVGGAALGAIIGGIAGGGKGAAIGAAIGGGVGAGSVFIEGGKELVLEPGTEILIRTAAPAREQD